MAASEDNKTDEKDWGTFPERCTMYAMLTGYVMSFKIPRFMINTIVPFIVADLGLSDNVTPTLLAAFHPGCEMAHCVHCSVGPCPSTWCVCVRHLHLHCVQTFLARFQVAS